MHKFWYTKSYKMTWPLFRLVSKIYKFETFGMVMFIITIYVLVIDLCRQMAWAAMPSTGICNTICLTVSELCTYSRFGWTYEIGNVCWNKHLLNVGNVSMASKITYIHLLYLNLLHSIGGTVLSSYNRLIPNNAIIFDNNNTADDDTNVGDILPPDGSSSCLLYTSDAADE